MSRFAWLVIAVFCGAATPGWAYVGGCPTLGKIIRDSSHIVVLQVDRVNPDKRIIIFKKVADLKGTQPAEEIRQQITDGWHPREPQLILDWAEPGELAICFQNGSTSWTCIGSYWYQSHLTQAPWWSMDYGRPELSLAYFGPAEKLRSSLTTILKGQEAVITAISGGNLAQEAAFKNVLRGKDRPIRRIKASANMPDGLYQLTIPPNWDPDPRYIIAGAGDPGDVPALLEALQHKEAVVRSGAARDLGWIGPAAKAALPTLTRALKDPEPLVRVRVAEALAQVDPENSLALSTLATALKEKDGKVRRAAAEALGDLGSGSPTVTAALGLALKDTEPKIAWAAAEALGRIGSPAEAAVPALQEALKDVKLRAAAADALGAMGPVARSAVPALTEVLKESKGTVRWTVALALARIGGPGARAAVPVLAEALTGDHDTNRACWDALQILEMMGPEARDAVPAVLAIVKRGGGQTFPTGTLWKIEPRAAIPYLIRDLKAGNELERKYMAAYLGMTGPDARDAIPVLLEMVRGGGSVGRISAWAVEMVREDYRAAAPLLLAGQTDGDGYVSRFSAQTLERFGPQARDAVPVLIDALADKAAPVRRAAASTLGRIGPEARAALPALEKLAQDEKEDVRRAAAEALTKIRLK